MASSIPGNAPKISCITPLLSFMASFSPSKYSSGSSLKPTFGSISYNNICQKKLYCLFFSTSRDFLQITERDFKIT
jgi:hypothetical protein